jgi:hypothetical protein
MALFLLIIHNNPLISFSYIASADDITPLNLQPMSHYLFNIIFLQYRPSFVTFKVYCSSVRLLLSVEMNEKGIVYDDLEENGKEALYTVDAK